MVEASVPANATAVSAKKGRDAKASDSTASTAAPTGLIEHVEVAVEAILGNCTIKVSDLTKLSAGKTLPLDRQINEAVEIRVNGRTIGHGEIVTVEDKFAVRITELG